MNATEISPKLQKRLRLASGLIVGGMSVEALTLIWSHPTSFLIFALAGGTTIVAGIVVYLWSLIS